MAKNLMESYKNRIALAESVHQKNNNGARMSSQKKLMLATVLDNTAKFMNEAFDSSAATQRSALGEFKKFCLNISTVALPNLILPELMLTHPMTSITGYVTYLQYSAGVDKGGVTKDTMFNSVFRHGEMTPERVDYTSDRVVETVSATGTFTPAWTPVLVDAFTDANGTKHALKVMTTTTATGATVETFADVTVAADGTVTYPTITVAEGTTVKVAYVYNNIVIPQTSTPNSLVTLKAELKGISLFAKARRIAIYYSQIAAFQAKTDYGYDLAEQIAAQAQGELAYEIDTEGVMMLANAAQKEIEFKSYDLFENANVNGTYISRSQYYEGFSEKVIAAAKKIIYTRTQKFAPNYMVCGANIVTILPYLKGWTSANTNSVNGPYYAGSVDGLKVYVSPSMKENEFFFGVNGSDLQTSAAVYAPYMAVVPTQLLGFADGGMSQGFSTMYDMKLLSTYNLAADGETKVDAEDGKYSWLLVGGELLVPAN